MFLDSVGASLKQARSLDLLSRGEESKHLDSYWKYSGLVHTEHKYDDFREAFYESLLLSRVVTNTPKRHTDRFLRTPYAIYSVRKPRHGLSRFTTVYWRRLHRSFDRNLWSRLIIIIWMTVSHLKAKGLSLTPLTPWIICNLKGTSHHCIFVSIGSIFPPFVCNYRIGLPACSKS